MVWAGYPKLSRIAWRTSVMASSDRPAPAISPSTRLPPAIPSEVRIRPIGLAATTSPPFVRPSKPSAMSRAKTSFSTYGIGRIAASIRPTRTDPVGANIEGAGGVRHYTRRDRAECFRGVSR